MKYKYGCIAALLAGVMMFSACGGSSSDAGHPEPTATTAEMASDYYDYEDSYYEWDSEEEAQELVLLTPDNDMGIKLVYTVSIQLETTDFGSGTRNLINAVADVDGYIVRTTVNGRSLRYPEVERQAVYMVKIPTQSLAAFLAKMEDDYNLVRLEQDSDDITVAYEQTDNRAEQWDREMERIQQAIEDTEDEDEIRILEQQLSSIRGERNKVGAAQNQMDRDVVYSTVTLHLYEVILDGDGADEEMEEFGERLNNTASNSWNNFVLFCQGILLAVIALLPILVILAVCAAIALGGYRLWKKNKQRIHKLMGNDDDKHKPE